MLLDKNLGVLADGVIEGRRIFANTMKYVLMATSSNFGNMFSAAGASLFLSFLPMLPSQILLNNLLYDVGQLAIPTDNVDPETVARPAAWDIGFVRRFMAVFGPVSSIFDFLTFFVMLTVLNASHAEFRSGWFVESLATQTLVVFLIRTRRVPFFRSTPSRAMLITPTAMAIVGAILPFTPGGAPARLRDPAGGVLPDPGRDGARIPGAGRGRQEPLLRARATAGTAGTGDNPRAAARPSHPPPGRAVRPARVRAPAVAGCLRRRRAA